MKRNRLLFLLVLLMTAATGAWAQTVTYPKYLVIDVATGNHRYTDDSPDLTNDLCRKGELWLRYIPAGTFLMGSPTTEPGSNGCENQHWVKLTKPFYIGVFECTQYQWKAIMSQQWSETTNPSTRPSWFNNESYWETRPVERVSYEMIRGGSKGMGWPDNDDVDANSFMDILRTKTGMKFDLPTEAQWEYACRAGTTTALNTGADLTDENMALVGRYSGNSSYYYDSELDPNIRDWTLATGTAKVGTYAPNAWNLYDMHGNVLEWCLDWNYSNSFDDSSTEQNPVEDPKGESYNSELGDSRAMRGGDWCSPASGCRSAYRGATQYDAAEAYSGFRIVCLTMPDPEQQHTYSVTMKSGTKDAKNWTITSGEKSATGDAADGLTGLSEKDAVTLQYSGNRQVKSITATTDAGPGPLATPLTIEAITAGSIQVENPKEGMQYSLNGGATKTAVTTDAIPVAAGDKVQFYGDGTNITGYGSSDMSDCTRINGIGYGFTCKVYGNIMSLVDEKNFATATTLSDSYNFSYLFADNSTLTDASGLLLPATQLQEGCYQQMFFECTALTAAPALPAMQLAASCYRQMFEGCTALTEAPVLPATKLVRYCYIMMFNYCLKLATVTCLATSGIDVDRSTSYWLNNAGSQFEGTKTVNTVSTANWPTDDDNGIPTDWTRVNIDN